MRTEFRYLSYAADEIDLARQAWLVKSKARAIREASKAISDLQDFISFLEEEDD